MYFLCYVFFTLKLFVVLGIVMFSRLSKKTTMVKNKKMTKYFGMLGSVRLSSFFAEFWGYGRPT